MGTFAAFVTGNGSSLRKLAEELGVSVSLLDRVDAGAQALPADLVPEISAIFKASQGTVLVAVGKTVASIDQRHRNASVPNLVKSLGPARLHPLVQPKTPMVVSPPPASRFLWVSAPLGGFAPPGAHALYVVRETPPTLAASIDLGPPNATSSRGVAGITALDSLLLMKTDDGAIASFATVSLTETDYLDPTYDEAFYVRVEPRIDGVWKTRWVAGMPQGFLQKIDPSNGAILATVDLSMVPAAATIDREPGPFCFTNFLHVFVIVDTAGAATCRIVKVDTGGALTVAESTGAVLDDSKVTMFGGGQICALGGSLWVGNAQETGPGASSVFAIDETTYVASSVPLDTDFGLWTGALATDDAKLFACFKTAGFFLHTFTLVRFRADGTTEASVVIPNVTFVGQAIVDGGFLWVTVKTTAFVEGGVHLALLQIDLVTLAILANVSLGPAGFPNVTFDVAATPHGPP